MTPTSEARELRPTGIRTLVSALKWPRPRPLDDGDVHAGLPCGTASLVELACRERSRMMGPLSACRSARIAVQ